MIDTPQIIQSVAQRTAYIYLKVPAAEIRNYMGPGISELMATIAAQGVAPAGPWFTHHLKKPDEFFDFEISVPVSAPVVAAGRVKPGELPSRRVARTVYHGPYEGLGAGWGEFEAWIKANGHKSAVDLWECYTVGPESGPDSSKWCTELNRPLID